MNDTVFAMMEEMECKEVPVDTDKLWIVFPIFLCVVLCVGAGNLAVRCWLDYEYAE